MAHDDRGNISTSSFMDEEPDQILLIAPGSMTVYEYISAFIVPSEPKPEHPDADRPLVRVPLRKPGKSPFTTNQPQNIRALMQHMTGRALPADQQCKDCAQGKGLWRECVVADPPQETHRACANCFYSRQGYRCSLGKVAPASPSPSSRPIKRGSSTVYSDSSSGRVTLGPVSRDVAGTSPSILGTNPHHVPPMGPPSTSFELPCKTIKDQGQDLSRESRYAPMPQGLLLSHDQQAPISTPTLYLDDFLASFRQMSRKERLIWAARIGQVNAEEELKAEAREREKEEAMRRIAEAARNMDRFI